MSARFFQSSTPQENQSIKCNDLTVRGSVVANESVSVAEGISLNGALSLEANSDPAVGGKIVLPAMAVYTQLTSSTATVSVASGDQQFIVDTFAGASIPAGTAVSFAVNNPSIVINKTIVVMNKMGSTAALTEVNDFVSITAEGGMTITRHNFGAGAATGLQRLCFKLIQTA
jgi:large exoprotein involved in heme utilization and adhesion